ncbi:MAG: translocation/assembly module TamB domain-containing protein, partial [Mucilaginibacter sp.]
MSGNLKGLPDMNKAYFDLNIADLNTSRTDIYQLVAADMIPSSFAVPENLSLKGNFKGTMKNFNTKLILRSSDGAVDLSGSMNMSRKGAETYSANIKTNNLNVGALTKQPQTVGTVTLTANVKGRGIDPKKLNLQFNGNVAIAYVKGYTYKNLVMKGTAVDGSYTASATMRDPNISFALNGKANMNKKYPSVNATVMVDSMNLKNLHLTKEDSRFHGKLVANVPTADPDYLNADIKATDLIYVGGGKSIKLDTVSLVSTANADSSTIRLKTPMLSAYMAGKYKLTQVGDAFQDLLNKYYNQSLAKGTAKRKYSPQQFRFGVRMVKTPLVEKFAPDLKQLDPVIINGRFDSKAGTLVVNGSMPKVVYGTEEVDNMQLAINTNNNALNYSLSADQIKASSSLDLLYTSISGSAQNNKLGISLQVRDVSKKERYRIAGVFSALPNEYQFSFLQNGLMLDYKTWTVNADNALHFGTKGIMAKDFTITNAGQTLSINSTSQQMNAPIDVDFKNFHIETLTRIAQQDSLQVGGVINGRAEISNFEKSPVFTSALNIGDFNFKGDTVGNIALKVNNQTQNAYAADVSITGKGNQVDMKGFYYTSPQSKFDLDLNIVRLNMKSIEGFSFGSLKESRGTISGQLKISGTTSAPAIRGDVHFNQVGFNVAMLNSFFTMPKESLTFDDQGIRFNDFTLVDSTGNKAVITGAVLTQNYSDFTLAMNIHTDNFRVINSTQANNRLYYGKLYLNSDISVKGNASTPRVDANITVNDKTDMTFVLPEDDPSLEDRQGVVEVINPHAPKADSILLAKQLDSLRKSRVNGLDVSATIRINKNAKFTVVVDERNGDVVKLQGEAQLNGGIDPSGKTNLTGTYTIEQGSYNLSYATVKRKFLFKKGSTITWNGDPTTADVNITAIYVANVPPIDLVSDQLGGDVQNNTMYKQKLPFNVDLAMKNQLLKPAISFNIVLPDSTYSVSPEVISTVNARLDQIRLDTNEMNKQVLGVLVLGHFIGDNPLQSQGGNSGVEGIVRNSVSSLLSDQLNKLAGNLIGGVQLSFDLTSGADYSTGVQQNRTDLNVGLSKKFLNDRITVSVGNNFNLEGQNQPGQKTTDIAGNVSVNYMLTKDGRYMIRVYRRDQYIVVEGQVVETGAGFTITYEFNKFKELFAKKTKQEKELQKQYKQEQKEKKQEQKD